MITLNSRLCAESKYTFLMPGYTWGERLLSFSYTATKIYLESTIHVSKWTIPEIKANTWAYICV